MRKRKRGRSFLSYLLYALCSMGPALAFAAPEQAAEVLSPASFYGTIAIHGCEVAADELLVRARPISRPNLLRAGRSAGPGPDHGFRSRVVKARAMTPGNFEFLFTGLVPSTPYRLGVKLLGQSRARCEKLVWDVSRAPLFLAGEGTLTLDAFVVNSRLEVWGEVQQGRAEATWVAADALDFEDPAAAVRQFRWRSLNPAVTGGQLQVSTVPFPHVGQRDFNLCNQDQPKIVYQHDFESTAGAWSMISVDFHAVLLGSGPDDSGPDDSLPVDGNTLTALRSGHPLYVRVISTIEGEQLCDPEEGVPAETILAKLFDKIPAFFGGPQFSVGTIWYTAPHIDPRPNWGETCYRLSQGHYIPDVFTAVSSSWEFLAGLKLGFDTGVGPPAQFCVSNASGDDGWLESFTNTFSAVLTGLVDEIAKLVNSASGLWEEIQDYSVQAVAAGLDEIPGVNCPPSPCQAALETGLEIGLATMGVPPSLPNFDQLVDQGVDYLAAQAASQVGVPDVLTDYASEEAQKFIKKAAQDMKDRPYSVPKLPNWLVPTIGFDPGHLVMELYGTGLPLSSRPGIIRFNDPLSLVFASKFVQIPSKLPVQGQPPLLFPMVLEPSLIGLPPAPSKLTEYEAAVWEKKNWVTQRYNTGCYHLYLLGLAPLGDSVFHVRDQWFSPMDASACLP